MKFYIIASVVACLAGVVDLKTHKIHNKLTITATLAGIILQIIVSGLPGVGNSILGLIIGGVTILFWFLNILKAGDTKLYMAIGAIGGWRFSIYTIIISTLVGGLAATVLLLLRKQGRQTIKHMWMFFLNCLYTKKILKYEPVSEDSYFSYGCCIGAGAVISALLLAVR